MMWVDWTLTWMMRAIAGTMSRGSANQPFAVVADVVFLLRQVFCYLIPN